MAFSFSTPTPGSSTPAASTSLFGTPASSSSQTAAAKPFSFGTPASTPAPSTSLFGTPTASTSQPSFGLFGSSQPASTGASAPSLFGSAPVASGQPSTGLFGQNSNSSTSQGLNFGAATPAPSTSLFGQPQANAQQQPSQQQFQQSQQQQQQTQQAPVSKNTKFEDLPENERKLIQEMETFISGRKSIEEELHSRDLGATIRKTKSDVQSVTTELVNLLATLEQSNRAVEDIRRRFELDLVDICKSVKIIDHFKGTTSAALVNQTTHGVVDSSFPLKFFRRKTEDMAERLKLYSVSIEELKGQISRQDRDQVKAILPTLKAQHGLALSLAGRVAAISDDLDDMRRIYTILWREKTGNTARDPFIDAGLPPTKETLAALSLN